MGRSGTKRGIPKSIKIQLVSSRARSFLLLPGVLNTEETIAKHDTHGLLS